MRWSTAASPARTSSTGGTRQRSPPRPCATPLRGVHLRPARGRAAGVPRADGRRPRGGSWRGRPLPPAHATGRAMVSFGQGCEGEPLTRYASSPRPSAASARRRTGARCNINTNASLTAGLAALFDAGLDAIRVSLNSAVTDLYEAYYQPDRSTAGEDVEASHRAGPRARGLPGAQPPDLPRRDRPRGRGGGAALARPAPPGGPGTDPDPVHRSAPVPGGGPRSWRRRAAHGHRADAPRC